MTDGANREAMTCVFCGAVNRRASAEDDLSLRLCAFCRRPLDPTRLAVACPSCGMVNLYPAEQSLKDAACGGCRYPLNPELEVLACPHCGAWNSGAKGEYLSRRSCQACRQPLDATKRTLPCPACGASNTVPANRALQDMACGKCRQPLDPKVTTISCRNCRATNIIPRGQTLEGRGCWQCRYPLNPAVETRACLHCGAWNSGPPGTDFSEFTCHQCHAPLDPGAAVAGSSPAASSLYELSSTQLQARIREHVTRTCGPIQAAYREQGDPDILHVPPSTGRNFHTLVTCGMSGQPMTAPAGLEPFARAELVVHLPADWPVKEHDGESWPLRCLRTLSRYPREQQAWLGPGYTIPNGNPPKPYARDTKLCCIVLLLANNPLPELQQLPIDEQQTIYFYQLLMLYREEMDFLLKRGPEQLLARFAENRVPRWVDNRRKNLCATKSRWPWS